MPSNTIKQFIQSVFIGSLLTTSLFSIASAQVTDTIDQVASSCVTLTKNMTIGAKDSTSDGQVSDLQFFLSDKGYLKTDPTGYFGQATLSAVKAFQGDNGITPNGLVGPLTRGKVSSVSCGGQEPTSTNTGSTGGSQTGGTGNSSTGSGPYINLSFSGSDPSGASIGSGSSYVVTNVDPLFPRTWTWSSQGASSVSAKYTITGSSLDTCPIAASYGGKYVQDKWEPWTGTSFTGDRFNGSNTRTLGNTYYGCIIDASFTGRNTSGGVSVSNVKVAFSGATLDSNNTIYNNGGNSGGTVTTPNPTATLTVPATCVIPVNSSRCNVDVTWNTSGGVSGLAVQAYNNNGSAVGSFTPTTSNGSQQLAVTKDATIKLFRGNQLLSEKRVLATCADNASFNPNGLCVSLAPSASTTQPFNCLDGVGTGCPTTPIVACMLAAPPAGCTYVPGPGYIGGQNCNLVLKCGDGSASTQTSVTGVLNTSAPSFKTFSFSPSTVSGTGCTSNSPVSQCNYSQGRWTTNNTATVRVTCTGPGALAFAGSNALPSEGFRTVYALENYVGKTTCMATPIGSNGQEGVGQQFTWTVTNGSAVTGTQGGGSSSGGSTGSGTGSTAGTTACSASQTAEYGSPCAVCPSGELAARDGTCTSPRLTFKASRRTSDYSLSWGIVRPGSIASCYASGGWSGTKGTSEFAFVAAPASRDTAYSLTCGGETQSVTLQPICSPTQVYLNGMCNEYVPPTSTVTPPNASASFSYLSSTGILKTGGGSNNCVVPKGSSSCGIRIDWTTTGATSANLYKVPNSTPVGSSLVGSYNATGLVPGISTGYALEVKPGNVQYSTLIGAECESGSSWNGTICGDLAASYPTPVTPIPDRGATLDGGPVAVPASTCSVSASPTDLFFTAPLTVSITSSNMSSVQYSLDNVNWVSFTTKNGTQIFPAGSLPDPGAVASYTRLSYHLRGLGTSSPAQTYSCSPESFAIIVKH